jgi:hypothetical protein
MLGGRTLAAGQYPRAAEADPLKGRSVFVQCDVTAMIAGSILGELVDSTRLIGRACSDSRSWRCPRIVCSLLAIEPRFLDLQVGRELKIEIKR